MLFMDSYDTAEVLAGLLLLGDDVPDPDWERRADLIVALRKINRSKAIACLLYARGYNTEEIGRYFKRSQPIGSRLLASALKDLRERMNGAETRPARAA